MAQADRALMPAVPLSMPRNLGTGVRHTHLAIRYDHAHQAANQAPGHAVSIGINLNAAIACHAA
jgi:hypothetical protein